MRATTAFNRLLERIEELSADCQRYLTSNQADQQRIRQLASENETLQRFNKGYAKLERFVESTPELEAAWLAFEQPPKNPSEEIPF